MAAPPVVLVGVDGSQTGRHALAWAAAEAAALRWSLLLVTAWTVPRLVGTDADLGPGFVDETAVERGAREVLDEALAWVEARPEALQVEARLGYGDAAGVLVDASERAGLAVVGKRGRGGFARRLLGGVSIALPAHAHCPTVVVPLLEEADRRARSGVVVGVDGSPRSDRAAHVAAEHAQRWDVPLTLVCGMPLAMPALAWVPVAVDPAPASQEAEEALAAAAERIRAAHPGLDVRHRLVQDTPARAVTEAGDGADLVAVGARGHGGFAGLLLGSVSQAVLAHASAPVLVVPERCAVPHEY